MDERRTICSTKNDREILVTAIERADGAFKKIHPAPSLLSSTPKGILDDLALAIDRCAVYKAVAGNILFNGSSAPIITSSLLAPRFFDKRDHWDGTKWVQDLPFAADWLIRLLTTQKAEAHLRVAIWGFSVKEEVKISDKMRVLLLARCQIRSIGAGFWSGPKITRDETCGYLRRITASREPRSN
jgi:hypothetical protein